MDLLGVTLKEFCKGDSILVVESSVLNDTISFVSNAETLKKRVKEIVGVPYLGEELLRILNLPPERLKQIHEVKKIFNGQILDPNTFEQKKQQPKAKSVSTGNAGQVKRFFSKSR